MRLKADCLFDAGIIDADDRTQVYLRTAVLLEPAAHGLPAEASILPAWMPTDVLREPRAAERAASAG